MLEESTAFAASFSLGLGLACLFCLLKIRMCSVVSSWSLLCCFWSAGCRALDLTQCLAGS